MKDFTSWERINLDPPGQAPLTTEQKNIRELAEAETNRDLKKPIQQLLCDVHEEVHQTLSISGRKYNTCKQEDGFYDGPRRTV